MNANEKILVAMSGGVDSAVTAHILQKQGYSVHGIYFELWNDNDQAITSKKKAHKLANYLGIKFHSLDLRSEFKREIVDYFINAYKHGITPNPCIFCNPLIKFKFLISEANKLNIHTVATGHYVRLKKENHSFHLLKGIDSKKDQSYFLYRLNQEILSRTIFPLGDKEKTEIKRIAEEINLPIQKNIESQEVCFIESKNTADFLKKNIQNIKSGPIKNIDGTIYPNQHKGLIYYTIGQRKGIEIGGVEKPLYVVNMDIKLNTLVVGSKNMLFSKNLSADNITFINPVSNNFTSLAKIRSQGQLVKCNVKIKNKKLTCEFAEPILSITTGQSVVFYRKDEVLGGGIIT